ncbi:MAG: hypothetical protein E7222_10425 [Clostridiales bacterium]|jgi:hypothetical protein|nr:hypothetical protein [Clostridiales bacterium]
MSKVFVVPDIHLKPWIFDEAEKQMATGNFDTVVLLGDLVDDWDQQENIDLYKNTFDAAISFINRHQNVLYCYGNHDVSYEWEALETGYSYSARETVLAGMEELKRILPDGNIAFVHRIDKVLFSHAGLTEAFLNHFFPDYKGKFNDLINEINMLGKDEMWCDASPIWARPQDGRVKLYPEGFMQVVGHTPVKKTDYFKGFLTVDNFSTYQDGTPIGDQRFVWVDTTCSQWGYVDQGNTPEIPMDKKSDIRNYNVGDWVLFRLKALDSEEDEYHEGVVEIIDRYRDGRSSIDVMCKNIFIKHVPLENVIELMTVGINGDSCLLPPRWEKIPGKIVERQ